jgi:general secretion pathway protein J
MTVYRWRSAKTVAGFTLLEALVAMALTGMILTALATITALWLPNWNRGFARVQQNEHLALGLERLVADLAAAEFVTSGREMRQPFFDGVNTAVTFVRSAFAPNAGPGLEIVRIAEIGTERGPTLVRTRARFVPVVAETSARDQPPFTDPVVLIRAPYRLSFAYAGPDRVWLDTWRRAAQLPRAIRLTLREAATQRTLAVSTATLVHAEVPAECILARSLADCIASRLRPPEAAEGSNPNGSVAGQLR